MAIRKTMAVEILNYSNQQEHGKQDRSNYEKPFKIPPESPSENRPLDYTSLKSNLQARSSRLANLGFKLASAQLPSIKAANNRLLVAILNWFLVQAVAGQLIRQPSPRLIYNSYNNELARRPYQLRRSPRFEQFPRGEQLNFRSQREANLLEASARQLSGIAPPLPGPPLTKRQLREQEVITQIILPDENYSRSPLNYSIQQEQLTSSSYVIDHKRFVEAVSSRCWSSTILDDPLAVEPSFIVIKPSSEIRLNATAPLELVRELAGFEPQKKTTIIVHGFTQSYPKTTWLRKIRGLFEVHSLVGRHNLIIMDWGVASHGSYAQVAAMVSGMGSFLSNFIMKLIDLGADRMSIHVIGHSLGAHLAGFAGKRIRPRLGRITALDPAGPCFGKIFSNSASDRLSPGDAFEVDVYHYDDDFLGLPGQHGQFDIYVNGGSSQPGCTDNMNTMFQAVLTMLFRRNRVLSESHTRSTEVATVQLSATGCQQVAYECRDYAAFTLGECGKCDDGNNQCFLMGFEFQYGELGEHLSALRTSFPGKRFYIQTSSAELFCSNHYQILIKFEPNSEQLAIAKRNKWRIHVELITDQQERINVSITNQMSPTIFSYLLLAESPRPIRIRAARLQMRASDGTLVDLQQPLKSGPPTQKSPPASIRVLMIEVNFMSNINPQIRRSMSSRLCPVGLVGDLLAPPSDNNAISDWPGKAGQSDIWLQFDECFFPA